MTKFKATYSDDFQEKSFVQGIIEKWNSGIPSFLLKTSGSTGKPKEVSLPRALLEWSCKSTWEAIAFNNNDKPEILCCLPIRKTGGFMQIIRALVWNCGIHFENPSNNLANYFENKDYNLTSLSPTQLDSLLDSNVKMGKNMTILVGGAPVNEKLLAELNESSPRILETYGMTETASNIATRQLSPNRETCFKPHKGVALEEEGNQLKIQIPELDLTVETNDLVKFHGNKFEILGRADDVINSGGVKIHPAIMEPLIENALSTMGINRNFYLTKKQNATFGEVAVLILEGVPIKDTAHILEILKRELPSYQNPKEILFIDKIEYTDTGKVIRNPY